MRTHGGREACGRRACGPGPSNRRTDGRVSRADGVMDGVIVADKPAGWTSHDVVAAVKKKLGARKVGHLGTLDPLATGVLLLVIDGATRASRLLEGGRKDYIAALKLGEATDTYDSEGTVVSTGDPSRISMEDILRALSGFTGRIRQVPPMYSSIKRGGVPLYRLARRGIVVERERREVEVFGIEALRVDIPCVEFRVVCSRGTYVRSICNDLGAALGCGAHMTGLRRMGSGAFSIDEAIGPEAGKDALVGAIIPLQEALRRSEAPSDVQTEGEDAGCAGAGRG